MKIILRSRINDNLADEWHIWNVRQIELCDGYICVTIKDRTSRLISVRRNKKDGKTFYLVDPDECRKLLAGMNLKGHATFEEIRIEA